MDKTQLGAFIAEKRKALGLTQKDLAARLHVTDKAVSKWERGLSYPDVTLLELLADTLGLNLTELVSCTPHAETGEETRKEQAMKDVLQLSTDSVVSTRKRGRRWIAVLAAVCLLLAAMLILLSKQFPLSRVLSLKGGTRIESAAVITAETANGVLPATIQLDDDQILLLEACLRDGTACWRGFSKASLIWNTGVLYTLHLHYNNGQTAECRILNGALYTDSYAYRLDAETWTMLNHTLRRFVIPSRWELDEGYTWEDNALLFWREGSYDTADYMMGHIYTSGEDTDTLRQMVAKRAFEENRDFTMRYMLSSDWFAGGAGKVVVDGVEYTFFDDGALYCVGAMQLATEPLTQDELAFLRGLHSKD